MRVALINNMNNNFFAFARYLRDLGVDAHIFIIDPLPQHFLPQADTFDDPESLSYIHYLNGSAMRGLRIDKILNLRKQLKQLYADLKTFDLIVACGNLAYFALKDIKIDVFMPYGGDAFQLIIQHKLSHRHGLVYLYHRFLAHLQSKAIKNSRVVVTLGSIDGNIANGLKLLNKNWLEGTIPMVYPVTSPSPLACWEFLKQHDFIMFSHTRQCWFNVEDYKGNEKYITAFSRFVKSGCRFKNPILVLFEYGDTVAASKELIVSLGIEKYVRWMPKMLRKEIFYGLAQASLAVDALTDTVATFGGAVFESFLLGIPVIGNAKLPNQEACTHLPLVQAFTEEEVYQILLDYQQDPHKYKQLGVKAQTWFDNNIGASKVAEYKKLFELLIKDPHLSMESPHFPDIVNTLTLTDIPSPALAESA